MALVGGRSPFVSSLPGQGAGHLSKAPGVNLSRGGATGVTLGISGQGKIVSCQGCETGNPDA